MRYELKPNLKKILERLKKRDIVAFNSIIGKIEEIVNSNPNLYKPLRHLHNIKRVHIMKSFVLVFSYDQRENFLIFLDYDHHDNIYKKYR